MAPSVTLLDLVNAVAEHARSEAAMIRDYVRKVPITHYYSWTLPPGLPPRWAQHHLELFASEVIPAFR